MEDELHALCDEFDRESDILLMMLDSTLESPDAQRIALTLSQAKRTRKTAGELVRCLAQLRDQLQP